MRKTSERVCMKFSGKVDNGPMNKRLSFRGDPDYGPDPDPTLQCLGGGMHCPRASSCKPICGNWYLAMS